MLISERLVQLWQGFSGYGLKQPKTMDNRLRRKVKSAAGKVYLIGAGSGDPELLTLKAHRLLQQADVIMLDWLVHPQLYQYFPATAERIFVGKKCGRHSMTQADICQLMLQQAQAGKTVVRLKGGDPSIFGRLAEETQILQQHHIPFAIVPGITAASACAAYTGIPLTHRDCAQSVRFVTAHRQQDQQPDWQTLAKSEDTLVFYMGLNKVQEIAAQLIRHGMKAAMPIAIIDKGSSEEQQLCSTTLEQLDATMIAGFEGPALIVVGEVVSHQVKVDTRLLEVVYG